MKTRVVHCKSDIYEVYVGRGRNSVWGNPFTHIDDRQTKAQFIVGSVSEAIASYRKWLLTQPQLLALLPSLKGKVLGCWCAKHGQTMTADDKPYVCHGQVLAELADAAPDDIPPG